MIYLGQRLIVPNAEVLLRTGVSTSETFAIDDKTAAAAYRTRIMANARQVFSSVTAQIAMWRKITSLGGWFYGAVNDLERESERLGRYIDNPGIGTNVVERETARVNQELVETTTAFERQNSSKLAGINFAYVAAHIAKGGASVVLAMLDRSGFIKAGYEAAIEGIEAYQEGASPGMSLVRGATQGVLEKVSIIDDKHGVSVVTKSINEAYKLMGETVSEILVFASKSPKPTPAELRKFVGQKVTSAAVVGALAPVKGIVSELDTRKLDIDLPSLEHGITSSFVEITEVVLEAIIDADDEKKKRDP